MQILQSLYVILLLATSHAGPTFDLTSIKCSVWDSPCLTKLLQMLIPVGAHGISELGTKALDPLHIPLIKVNQGGLKVEMENVEICGLTNTTIQKVRVDKYSKLAVIKSITPGLTWNSTYTAAGFYRTHPVTGKGDVYLRPGNLELDMVIFFDVREDENGKKFIELNDYYYSFEVLDDMMVLLNNLYGGDQIQSAAAHNYIHKYWKQLSAEFGRPLITPMIEKVYHATKVVLSLLSSDNFLTDL